MNNFKIDKMLFKEIEAFVELNSLGDLNAYINNLIKKGFTLEKYDSINFGKTIKVPTKTVKSEEIIPLKTNNVLKEENNNEEIDLYNE